MMNIGLGKYVLDKNGEPVLEPRLLVWATWFENRQNCVVKQERYGTLFISTIFLGIDHRCGDGPPILWETGVFSCGSMIDRNRCSGTREQAEAMHEAVKQKMKSQRYRYVIPEIRYQLRLWYRRLLILITDPKLWKSFHPKKNGK